MLTDPQASRDGDGPYELLAPAGIGPGSSMKEILDASFVLMEQRRWSPQVRTAWDELRTVERRLVVDFLRPPLDAPNITVFDQHPPVPGTDLVEFDR